MGQGERDSRPASVISPQRPTSAKAAGENTRDVQTHNIITQKRPVPGQPARPPTDGRRPDAGEMLRASFEQVFIAHFEQLTRALSAWGDQKAAEDAVQDAFVEAWRRWSWLHLYENPPGWIFKIATQRLNRNYTRHERGAELERQAHVVSPARRPLGEAEQAVVAGLTVRAAIARLPNRLAAVICLRYLGDYQLSEIADLLGIPLGTAKSRLRAGEQMMADLLDRPEDRCEGGAL
jgi:RNA polymerase sigma factor (sigma-70 family)